MSETSRQRSSALESSKGAKILTELLLTATFSGWRTSNIWPLAMLMRNGRNGSADTYSMSFRGVIVGAPVFLFCGFVMDTNAYTLARAWIAVESPGLSQSLFGPLSPNTDYIGEFRAGKGRRSTTDSIVCGKMCWRLEMIGSSRDATSNGRWPMNDEISGGHDARSCR